VRPLRLVLITRRVWPNHGGAEKAMAAHIQKSWDYLNARKKEWVSR